MARVVKDEFGLSLYEGMYGARYFTFLNKVNTKIALVIVAPKNNVCLSLVAAYSSLFFQTG